MKASLVFFLFVALIAFATAFHSSLGPIRRTEERRNGRYTYLLAMNRRVAGAPNTLHGLWPAYAQDCKDGDEWDLKQIEPLRAELDTWWPSFNHADSTVFWQHEWEKHGTCYQSRNNGTIISYFAHTLDLLHQYTPYCDDLTKTDCRCKFDEYFNLMSCTQKN